jgi:hypothetical protein
MIRHPGPAELGLAGLNVVLALARCGRCTLAPPELDCA